MGFYFTLPRLTDCLDSVITCLNLLCFWSYGPFTVVSHSLFEQLVQRVVEFNFWCCGELGILGFEEWANRGNVFPVFPDWSKGCLNNVCTRYTLESVSRYI